MDYSYGVSATYLWPLASQCVPLRVQGKEINYSDRVSATYPRPLASQWVPPRVHEEEMERRVID